MINLEKNSNESLKKMIHIGILFQKVELLKFGICMNKENAISSDKEKQKTHCLKKKECILKRNSYQAVSFICTNNFKW